MNKYLIFRTDRIGDFLVSAILIKAIKKNDPKSHITIISSKKNYSYIKKIPFVDNVIELKNNFFGKLDVIFQLFKFKFKNIIIHDDKKRSKFISTFLRYENRILIEEQDRFKHIEIIKNILKKMNFLFFEESLNVLNYKSKKKQSSKNYIQIHFDEKWIHKNYVNNYVNIEPSEEEFINFLNSIAKKKYNELRVTTGLKPPLLLSNLTSTLASMNIKLYVGMSFHELEDITLTSNTLISCHGAISHVASANEIKQIDIIDKSYDYSRWTNHFRNYNFLYRESFKILSKKIIDKI